jgi:hypothetical protein
VGVIHSTIVENALRAYLSRHMRSNLNSSERKRLFGSEGIMASFSAKIITAYALGDIGPVTRSDLDLVRFMRNEFAHSRKPMTFETAEVIAVCAHLQFPELPMVNIPTGGLDRTLAPEDYDKTIAKTRYRITCHNITVRLIALNMGIAAHPDIKLPPDPLP